MHVPALEIRAPDVGVILNRTGSDVLYSGYSCAKARASFFERKSDVFGSETAGQSFAAMSKDDRIIESFGLPSRLRDDIRAPKTDQRLRAVDRE